MLSEKAQKILERITGKLSVGKGKKLVIGDGAPHLEADTIAFVKSLTEAVKSDLTKSILAGRRIATAKRAPMVPIDPLAPAKPTPTTPTAGLSDADLRVLEQEITAGSPALAPAEATKLFMQSYRVIAANGGRRLTAED
jgi:hypothetical protein